MSDIDRIGKFALVDLKNLKKDKLKGHNKVSWSTVASYKGLENDIIILIEFDEFTEDLNYSILYTLQ